MIEVLKLYFLEKKVVNSVYTKNGIHVYIMIITCSSVESGGSRHVHDVVVSGNYVAANVNYRQSKR